MGKASARGKRGEEGGRGAGFIGGERGLKGEGDRRGAASPARSGRSAGERKAWRGDKEIEVGGDRLGWDSGGGPRASAIVARVDCGRLTEMERGGRSRARREVGRLLSAGASFLF